MEWNHRISCYYGPAAGNYTSSVDVGNSTAYTVVNLVEGQTYHFAATDYDATHTESTFSNDISATVAYSAPVAQFSASTTSGTAPLALNFTNASTGVISTYAWTFGNSTTSSSQNPSHVYNTAGTYTVALTVTGPGGSNSTTKTNYITVSAATAPPVAAINASVTSGTAPLTVKFTSISTGAISTYAWAFGDGVSSAVQNPNHVYTTAGTYAATLTVTGPGGSSSSSKTIQVSAGVTTSTTTVSSSLNPSSVGANIVFTATVTGTTPSGSVNFTDGIGSIGSCSAVLLTGSGNTRTATCGTASLGVGTHSVVARYNGDAGNTASTGVALSQVVNGGAGGSSNVALASNGGVASASSFYPGFEPSGAINNERTGTSWGAGAGWNDATPYVYPDWLQVNFNGSKTIDHVVVYTLQDSFNNPVEPTDTLTFSLYGVVDFTVQGWDGSNWVTLGSVVGNNLVKRTVNFGAFTTNQIRINVTNALGGFSRIVEVEAWTSSGGPSPSTTAVVSSLNPSTTGANVTFTATVTGAAPTGSVSFSDGASALCATVGFSGGSSNTRTATCSTSGLTPGTHSIIAAYSGDANNQGSASTPLSQVVNGAGGSSSNVALASNGGVASASSFYPDFEPSGAINNERTGYSWGASVGWNDATPYVYPDWLQVNFNGSKTIDHVVVYTLQDSFNNPVEPTDTLTFSLYGVVDFTVQGWDGSNWVTLGTVSGNNLVKRTVNFGAFTTDRIRINVTNALGGFSRIVEVEAWGN